MQSEPLVAIAIPSYNHAKFLPSLFDSILRQDYKHLNVLVSDDASTDNSAEIMAEYSARFEEAGIGFRAVVQEKNLGPWGNFVYLAKDLEWLHNEVGLDYIQFIESDDYLVDGSLRKKLQFLKANPEYVAVHTDVTMLFEDGTSEPAFWKRYRPGQPGAKESYGKIPVGDIRQYLEYCNFIYTCTMLVEADKWLKHYDYKKFLDLGLRFGDYAFFLQLSKDNGIGYIDESLSVYRNLSNSMSHAAVNRPWIIEDTLKMQELARKGVL